MLPEHYVFTGQQNLRRPRRKFPGENISCFSCRGQCIVVFAGAKSQEELIFMLERIVLVTVVTHAGLVGTRTFTLIAERVSSDIHDYVQDLSFRLPNHLHVELTSEHHHRPLQPGHRPH
nr:uncharacterized protein LOC109408631 [Aedes albopictus]